MTAIVFDLDGTLIDSVGDIHAALNQMLAQAGHAPLDVGTVTSFVGKGSSNLVKRVIDHVGLPNDAVSHTNYLTEFMDIYTSAPARFTTVFDQVHEVLKDFQSSGIALGLCTNKPQGATDVVLEEFGLAAFGLRPFALDSILLSAPFILQSFSCAGFVSPSLDVAAIGSPVSPQASAKSTASLSVSGQSEGVPHEVFGPWV